jgi:anhydro-N-acetylmuramic acid kinase
MDDWCRRHRGQPFDTGGQWAAQAAPAEDLLRQLFSDPYFERAPPKSTGTQHFSMHWLDGHLGAIPALDPGVVQASLLELSARSISEALRHQMPEAQRVLACGGGTANTTLMARLQQLLGLPVDTTDVHGIPSRWMEAMAFAWLAGETLNGRRGNLPGVTGARGSRILGCICPA